MRDAGGPITRIQFGPKWLLPPIVAVMSPDGIRDVLGRNDASSERCIVHEEVRHMAGDSLFVLPNEPWLPRKRALQPVFTKHERPQLRRPHVAGRAGVRRPLADGGEVDLDVECRTRDHAVAGPLGARLDLNERDDVIAEHMHVASSYTADRALRPVRAPRWLPTPRTGPRACGGRGDAQVTDDMLQACRADPTSDAPLVHALIAATDPKPVSPSPMTTSSTTC